MGKLPRNHKKTNNTTSAICALLLYLYSDVRHMYERNGIVFCSCLLVQILHAATVLISGKQVSYLKLTADMRQIKHGVITKPARCFGLPLLAVLLH